MVVARDFIGLFVFAMLLCLILVLSDMLLLRRRADSSRFVLCCGVCGDMIGVVLCCAVYMC